MQDSKIPFCFSKFPWARERISPKIDNLGTWSQKGSPALVCSDVCCTARTQGSVTDGLIQSDIDPWHKWAWHMGGGGDLTPQHVYVYLSLPRSLCDMTIDSVTHFSLK
jgi:hypothetical protein